MVPDILPTCYQVLAIDHVLATTVYSTQVPDDEADTSHRSQGRVLSFHLRIRPSQYQWVVLYCSRRFRPPGFIRIRKREHEGEEVAATRPSMRQGQCTILYSYWRWKASTLKTTGPYLSRAYHHLLFLLYQVVGDTPRLLNY